MSLTSFLNNNMLFLSIKIIWKFALIFIKILVNYGKNKFSLIFHICVFSFMMVNKFANSLKRIEFYSGPPTN